MVIRKRNDEDSKFKLSDIIKRNERTNHIFFDILNDLNSIDYNNCGNEIQMSAAYATRAAFAALYVQCKMDKNTYELMFSTFKEKQLLTDKTMDFQLKAFASAIEFMSNYNNKINENLIKKIVHIAENFEIPKHTLNDEELFELIDSMQWEMAKATHGKPFADIFNHSPTQKLHIVRHVYKNNGIPLKHGLIFKDLYIHFDSSNNVFKYLYIMFGYNSKQEREIIALCTIIFSGIDNGIPIWQLDFTVHNQFRGKHIGSDIVRMSVAEFYKEAEYSFPKGFVIKSYVEQNNSSAVRIAGKFIGDIVGMRKNEHEQYELVYQRIFTYLNAGDQPTVDQVFNEVADQIYLLVSSKIETKEVAYQFILEELEAASQGNQEAQEFVARNKFTADEYEGALENSMPEVDGPGGPQQTLLTLLMQTGASLEMVASIRIKVVQKIINFWFSDEENPQDVEWDV